jgi:hypothetical protein
MGAGVSISAVAPNWSQLLQSLAGAAGLGLSEQEALKKLSNLDQADVLRSFFSCPRDSDARFGHAVADAVDVKNYGLAPSFLSCLPSNEAITLNYDTHLRQHLRTQEVLVQSFPAISRTTERPQARDGS